MILLVQALLRKIRLTITDLSLWFLLTLIKRTFTILGNRNNRKKKEEIRK